MKCSDLNKKAFILDRELLAKDDYLNFLAQPKGSNYMRRTASCPCQRIPNIPPASYRINYLAQPKKIYAENVCNMSIFRVETMMNRIAKRDYMAPKDMLRAMSEANTQQRNKECREKKLESQRVMEKACKENLNGVLSSMRTAMVNMDPLRRNSTYYRDIHADLLKLINQNPDQIPYELPKHILSKIALKAAHRVEKIVDQASQQSRNEMSIDCLEDCARDKYEIENCFKRQPESGDDIFEDVEGDENVDDAVSFGDCLSPHDSCDDILRNSQLNMEGVDCNEIFAKIEGYQKQLADRNAQQEAKLKTKAEKLAKRAAKKAAAQNATVMPECVPGAGGKKKWEVSFGRQD